MAENKQVRPRRSPGRKNNSGTIAGDCKGLAPDYQVATGAPAPLRVRCYRVLASSFTPMFEAGEVLCASADVPISPNDLVVVQMDVDRSPSTLFLIRSMVMRSSTKTRFRHPLRFDPDFSRPNRQIAVLRILKPGDLWM